MSAPEPREALERRWLQLTRETLPGLAGERDWPIRADHCFQRVLLDAACEGRWYDHIAGRPAYRAASDVQLTRAVALAEAAVSGDADVAALDRASLSYRKI